MVNKEPYNNRVERKIFVRHAVCSGWSKQFGLTANVTPAPAGIALPSAIPASNISAHSSVIRTMQKLHRKCVWTSRRCGLT